MAPSNLVYWNLSGAAAFRPAGAIPASAPTVADNGAGLLNGAYTYFITYYDSTNDHETNSNATGTAFSGASRQSRVTFTDTPPTGITHRNVYRNAASGSVWYKIASVVVATGTYDDNLPDASLSTGLGLIPEDNNPPPTLVGVHRHAARVFGFNGSALYWSEASDPEAWPPLNAANITFDDGYDITALATIGDDLVIFKRIGVSLLGYDDDPLPPSLGGNGWTQPALEERGCLNRFCVAEVNGAVFSMDDEGIYAYFGNRDMADIGRSIQGWLSKRKMELAPWFSCVATKDRIRWFVAMEGDTATAANPSTQWAIVLDLESMQGGGGPRWWIEWYAHPIRHASWWRYQKATTAVPANWMSSAMLDAKGSTAMLDWMLNDGVTQNLTTSGSVTSSAGTPVVVTASGTYTGSKFNTATVVGLYVIFVNAAGVVSRPWRITAIGANTFTLEGGAVAPNDGDTFHIGSIQTVYDLPVFSAGQPFARKSASYFNIGFVPAPSAFSISVLFNRDRWGFDYAADSTSEGRWLLTVNQTAVTGRMGGNINSSGGSGVLPVPCGSEAWYVIQPRIYTIIPNSPWQIYAMEFDAESMEVVSVGGA